MEMEVLLCAVMVQTNHLQGSIILAVVGLHSSRGPKPDNMLNVGYLGLGIYVFVLLCVHFAAAELSYGHGCAV